MGKSTWIVIIIAGILALSFTIRDVIAEYAGWEVGSLIIGLVAAFVALLAYWGYDQFFKKKVQ